MQLFTGVTVVPLEDFSLAAQMIERDEIGGLLTDFPICKAMIKENPDAGFVALFSLLTYEPIGIALPANDAQFINWTQNFLHRLDGTDTLLALKEKWFGETVSGDFNFESVKIVGHCTVPSKCWSVNFPSSCPLSDQTGHPISFHSALCT